MRGPTQQDGVHRWWIMGRPRRRDNCEYSNKRTPTKGPSGTGFRIRRKAVGRTGPETRHLFLERGVPGVKNSSLIVAHGIGFAQCVVGWGDAPMSSVSLRAERCWSQIYRTGQGERVELRVPL